MCLCVERACSPATLQRLRPHVQSCLCLNAMKGRRGRQAPRAHLASARFLQCTPCTPPLALHPTPFPSCHPPTYPHVNAQTRIIILGIHAPHSRESRPARTLQDTCTLPPTGLDRQTHTRPAPIRGTPRHGPARSFLARSRSRASPCRAFAPARPPACSTPGTQPSAATTARSMGTLRAMESC